MEPAGFLTSFAAVARHLQATGREVAVAGAGDVLQCRYTDGANVAPVAMRALQTRSGAPWLALSVPICPMERIRPRAALVANDVLPMGALALWEATFILRHTLPLRSLTPESLEQTLRALTRTAGRLIATAVGVALDRVDEPTYRYLFR
jgi:hypothetical protein